MIPFGLVLLVGAAWLAAAGSAGYFLARRSTGKSRAAAVALFGHGALATSGLLWLAFIVHVHAVAAIHLHSLEDAFREAFACDLEWSCAAWTAGLVAVSVLGLSFVVSQVASRAVVARARRIGAKVQALREDRGVVRLIVPEDAPDAYSVALLERGGRFGLRARDYVIMTSGTERLLAMEERDAVLEHELAHVRARDDRYLPYFHALTSIVFFDPILRLLRDRLGRRYELEADGVAARKTRNPKALARAILKVYEGSVGPSRAPGFLGRRRCLEIVERIDRLLALAARMEEGLE